jgi:branched-chain amino acid transport system substrate-binding protein
MSRYLGVADRRQSDADGARSTARSRPVNKLRFVKVGASGLILCLVAAACGSGSGSKKDGSSSGSASPYNVEIISSLTGTSASTGIASADGFQAVFDHVNSQGGINGHPVKFEVLDDHGSTTTAAAQAHQALSNNPVAIMDGSTSTVFTARLPAYKTAAIPVIGLGNGSADVLPWLYLTNPTAAQQGQYFTNGAAAALGGSLKGKKIAIAYAATPGGQASAEGSKGVVAKQGGTVVKMVAQTLGAPSFASGAADIVSSGADAVMIPTTSADTVVIANGLLDAGYKGYMIGGITASDTATFAAIGSPNYVAPRVNAAADPGSTMLTTAKKFNLTAGAVNQGFGQAWAMAYLLVAGLQKCAFPCAPAALQTALDSLGEITIPGGAIPFGKVVVSATSHNVLTAAQLYHHDADSKTAKTIASPFPLGSATGS